MLTWAIYPTISCLKSLWNNKILDWSKVKAFPDDKNVTENLKFVRIG